MNTTYQDNSVHESEGIILTGGNSGKITIIQGKADKSSKFSWSKMEDEIQMVLNKIENTQNEVFKSEFLNAKEAINQRDESKLKNVAKAIGRIGIDILAGLSANVLADFLTKSL